MVETNIEIDWDILSDQQKYLAWLRRRTLKQLNKHHQKVFPLSHRFYMKMPGWCPRYYRERRLYFWYAATHYRLPFGTMLSIGL